ncbi:MAG: SDR family oxidoreductase [Gammaproteobacteria bacterium]|nr:SDR family oxidoreductase [Gammaproteobacteria bacterium]
MNSTAPPPAARTGPVALITGGGRGIGRALALRLARAGTRVVLAARSRAQLDAVVAEIQASGGTALAAPCDVTVLSEVTRTLALAVERFGPITLLINNAGNSGALGPIGVVDPLAWWNTQTVHVLGALQCMSAVIPGMAHAGGGRIINVASQAGTFVAPNSSAYCVAKCTLIRLTEHVDAEWRHAGIRAFAIQPGTITTQMARETLADPAAERWAAPLVTLLRSVTPADSDRAEALLQQRLAELAEGRWDALAGRYLDVAWDLEVLQREAAGR